MTTMTWVLVHPEATPDMLGFIPDFLGPSDSRPAREQFHDRYAHGGGWLPFSGFAVLDGGAALQYPGDPPLMLLAQTQLRAETVRVYEGAWVAVFQADDACEISRMD